MTQNELYQVWSTARERAFEQIHHEKRLPDFEHCKRELARAVDDILKRDPAFQVDEGQIWPTYGTLAPDDQPLTDLLVAAAKFAIGVWFEGDPKLLEEAWSNGGIAIAGSATHRTAAALVNCALYQHMAMIARHSKDEEWDLPLGLACRTAQVRAAGLKPEEDLLCAILACRCEGREVRLSMKFVDEPSVETGVSDA